MNITGPHYEGELSDVESDPRLQELVMRQHKTLIELTARQSQEYVRLALTIRKEQTCPDCGQNRYTGPPCKNVEHR